MSKVISHPLAPLFLFSVALSSLLSAYLMAGFAPSATFEFAATFSWMLLLAFWLVADARRRSATPCFDSAARIGPKERELVHQAKMNACKADTHWRTKRALRDAKLICEGTLAPRQFFW
jgi:hypothetical protein